MTTLWALIGGFAAFGGFVALIRWREGARVDVADLMKAVLALAYGLVGAVVLGPLIVAAIAARCVAALWLSCGGLCTPNLRALLAQQGDGVGDDGTAPAEQPLNEVDRFRRGGAL